MKYKMLIDIFDIDEDEAVEIENLIFEIERREDSNLDINWLIREGSNAESND